MSVYVRIEAAAVLRDLAHLGEREDLETAGVGEYRAVPAHEAVKPACCGYDLWPGTKQKMIRVAQNHLRAELDKIARAEGLDGSKSADVHEDRRFDDAMRGSKASKSRLRARILCYDLETHDV